MYTHNLYKLYKLYYLREYFFKNVRTKNITYLNTINFSKIDFYHVIS